MHPINPRTIVTVNATTEGTAIPMIYGIKDNGWIEMIPGKPAAPIATAFTLNNVTKPDPMADPIIARINGYLSRKLIPNIAGSVIRRESRC